MLAAPGKVTSVQTKGSVLGVSTAHTNGMDALCTQLSVCWLATELELSLFAIVRTLSAGCGTLMTRGSGDT